MIKIAAVTACPTGIAHTHLAAEALQATAVHQGMHISVERQGAHGTENQLSASTIEEADLIIIAADIQVDMDRFEGKHVYKTTTSKVIRHTDTVLSSAMKLISPKEVPELPLENDALAMTEEDKPETLSFVAITACPTGIAHTFMAADALKKTAAKKNYEIFVETQGSVGSKTPLTSEQIANADYVVIAADTHVNTSRFAGKKVYRTGVGDAVKQPEQVLDEAIQKAAVINPQDGDEYSSAIKAGKEERSAQRSGPYKHLLTGVSFMLPMVVAGGLIIAISFIFGIDAAQQPESLAAGLMSIGQAAFGLMVPVLAGYIAFSIADRPGLAPGLVGGMLANTIGAGFLGGILAGFLAGYVALWMRDKLHLPQNLEGLKPVLVIPLLSTLVVGLLMVYVIGEPVAAILAAMTTFLQGMGTQNAILLGLVIGGMMAVDMGGPVNKAAYAFAVGLLTTSTYGPMAAVMAAGMTPPLGISLATVIAKNRFTKDEQNAGKAAAVLGLSFITEGAIPFAAKDPARVIPACIIGSAIAGGMSMAFGCQLLAPHGGIFVLAIPNAVTHVAMYGLSILAGTVLTALALIVIKPPLKAS
ncbi:PTS fructose-like transporter subunit IIB [Flexibacterium corallicola]|uniref:PTS fructose-like transporter subunit IIB n=1 Tax=Flexibacterium corallicola TaxID=3037259 RepID=UPI00286F7EB3|nr:PTS fructose-like transporter subunit IIB [Pseudovibrio sp. M1P-2-3]